MIVFVIAILALFASAGAASASPLLIPILTAVGFSAGAAAIIAPIAVAALSIGVSLLLTPKPRGLSSVEDGGVQLDIQAAGDVPETLIVGRAVLAGSRAYIETYGDNNQNCIEIIALGDHPSEGLVQPYVEAQEADLTDTGTDRGFTVDGYDGNLALRFFDGSQTSADSYAVSALSGHSERPWTASHKGTGRTYARVHYVYNREKVGGPLNWKFVVDGIKLYDPRYDTTAGGSGSQRFDDLDTHVFTKNLAVIAYNILRGIRVKNASGTPVHFYGLEGTPAANLPLDVWFAAMNEADTTVSLAGGGTEPQYHGGLEIPVKMAPMDAIREIMKATGGRFIEIGGIYKLYLGAPGVADFSFDDGVIPANRSDAFNPIRPLDQKVTFVSGSYVSPDDGWIEKVPPPRIDTDLEDRIGRRVEADLSAPMVQSGSHIQRVMLQMMQRAARQRRHSVPLPPAYFGVEPGMIASWTSPRNGYSAKLFEVESAEIDANLGTVVNLLEVDAADYDWESTDEIDQAVGSLVQGRPAAKVISGLDVIPYTHTGDTGVRMASARVVWVPPDDDDIIGLAIQLRQQSSPSDISSLPTIEQDEVAAGETRLIGGFASLTEYALRGRWKSFNGWATDWSLWRPFTTTDARVSVAELDATLNALLDQLRVEKEAALATALEEIRAQIESLAQQGNGAYALVDARVNRIVNAVGQRVGSNEARVTTLQQATADNTTALALFFVDLLATTGGGTAEAQFQIAASSTPDGAVAAIEQTLRAGIGGELATAAFRMAAYYSPSLGAYRSRIQLEGDSVDLIDEFGAVRPLMKAVIADSAVDVDIEAGTPNKVTPDLRSYVPVFYTQVTADIEIQFPLGAWLGAEFSYILEMDGTGGWVVSSDASTITQPFPTVEDTANVTTVLKGLVTSISPPKMTYAIHGEPGQVSSDSVTLFGVYPAVEGKTVWNLAIDGDFEPPPGTYTITPLGDDGLQCNIELFGPGGSTGGYGVSNTDGGAGTDSSFETESGNVVAGAGGRTTGSGALGQALQSGGAAGTASGGDTNTNGSAGQAGQLSPLRGGDGAAAPSGGGAVANDLGGGGFGTSRNGVNGNAPGGGAAGGSTLGSSASTVYFFGGGGGGSGAKAVAALGSGALLKGVSYLLVVGDSGAAGTGAGNVPYGPYGDVVPAFNGGKGAPGSARLYL